MTITIRQMSAEHVEAGRKGGEVTASRHESAHYKQIGAMPPRPGSRRRGRPAIPAYVIGTDGLIYTGREAVKQAQEATSFNPGYSDND